MLEELLGTLNNYFDVTRVRGSFSVRDGAIEVDGAQPGQWVRIVGSTFNDGVHRYPGLDLRDEDFDGEVWLLAVPAAVESLASEIEAWSAKHPADSLTSESFGGYTYSRATTPRGIPAGWRDVFARDLARWRKI